MAVKTSVIIPDIQHPFHDSLALTKIIKVIEDIQPDAILQIGDAIDFPQVSRWTKGTAGEYAGIDVGRVSPAAEESQREVIRGDVHRALGVHPAIPHRDEVEVRRQQQ